MNGRIDFKETRQAGPASLWLLSMMFAALFAVPESAMAQIILPEGGTVTLARDLEAIVEDLEAAVADLEAQNAALESALGELQADLASTQHKLVHFSRVGNDIYIDGANLHVRNGLGDTSQANSLGNIIIGYNTGRGRPCRAGEDAGGSCDNRSGSHMLVVGRWLNYTASGGIVAGAYNASTGNNASVTGGVYNTARGHYSSVTGGGWNTATMPYSSVTGGRSNTAGGYYSSVAGGFNNAALGTYSSVAGGSNNQVRETYSHLP